MNVQTSPVPKTAGVTVRARRRSPLKLLLLLAAILIAGAAAFVYWPMLRGPVATNQLILSGNIEAHQSLVSFRDVSSRIIELPIEEGQWVEKGALLARLDDSNYRQQVAVNDSAVRGRGPRASGRNGRGDSTRDAGGHARGPRPRVVARLCQ